MYLLCSLVKMYEFMTFRAVELLSAKFRIRGRKINGADQPSEAKSTPPWWWQGNKIENELDKMASGCQNTCPRPDILAVWPKIQKNWVISAAHFLRSIYTMM